MKYSSTLCNVYSGVAEEVRSYMAALSIHTSDDSPVRDPRRRRARALSVALVSVMLTAACSSVGGGSVATSIDEMDPAVLKFATTGHAQDNMSTGFAAFQEAINERTGGKVTFEPYFSSSLLGGTDMLSGVSDGVADMGFLVPAYYPEELPVSAWMGGLGNLVTGSTVHDVVAGGAASYESTLSSAAIHDQYARQGVEPLLSVSSTALNLLCNNIIETPAQAKGVETRSFGSINTALLKDLGMVPVDVAASEAYEAVQRGVIDCLVNSPSGAVDLGLTEVASEYIPVNFPQQQELTIVLNSRTWEGLPGDVQDIFREESANWAKVVWGKYLEAHAGFGALLSGANSKIRIDDVSKFAPALDAERQAWLDDMPNNAPAAIENPQKVIDAYRARVDYWTQALEQEGYALNVGVDREGVLKGFAQVEDFDINPFFDSHKAELLSATTPK
ncbi:TRAP transporter substrate-binding protein DctP (plasmid) [Rhodococcus sp. USK10]|uniref:TRAP transporter substrate-binding protein DctP n=1 Tax=Rhodococcus sp. USK10 TaxID=2789739 RepID=UPI001C5FD2D7|nr:TRAP transporter substrate-binding protein DctP [Rhodococcus sp. USK10]QYA99755.1 TRAP transporter substrate-binding protein DctP [Rhodococcus sp. USK10]